MTCYLDEMLFRIRRSVVFLGAFVADALPPFTDRFVAVARANRPIDAQLFKRPSAPFRVGAFEFFSGHKASTILALMLLLAAPVSAQPVRDVPDVLSYGTMVLNPGWAAWKAYKSADPACGLSKLAISEAVGNGAVLILKHFIHSERPCPGCAPDGMPSGHSMNGAIGAFSNGGWGFALAVPTPWLRVGANRHTTKQAVVGSLIGLGADAFGQFVMKCGS